MKELRKILEQTKPDILTKREDELRQLILKHPNFDEKSLAYILWPKDPHQMVYLRYTRGRLLKQVRHTVLDLKDSSEYQAKFSDCHKDFMVVQVLRSMGMRKEMVYFAERLIKRALRLEMSELVRALADNLYFHYGSVEIDNVKAKKYLELAQEYEAIQTAEIQARRNFVRLARQFSKSYVGDPGALKVAQEVAEKMQAGLANNETFQYRYLAYYAIALCAQLARDKELLIKTCNDALKFFQGKSYPIPNSVQFLFGFELQIALAIKSKDFQFARRAVKMGEELAKEIPLNYSLCLSHKAIIGFHEQDDELVATAITESKAYREFPALQEYWLIIDAFAYFLEIDADVPFRVGKFLNEVPIYSQDKQGLNITIIVIQVLFLIKRRKYGALIDKWEALRKYSSRYLKKDHTFRSACFLKMILMLPTHNFHPAAIERHTSGLLKRLRAYPESDIEIVPYERLWGTVCSCVGEYYGV